MGENPGRPAYPCAISSCNSKVVLSTLSSKAQVLDTRTINQDRKACTKSNWVHISVTNHSTMTQTDLWSITRPWINVTRHPGLGRPEERRERRRRGRGRRRDEGCRAERHRQVGALGEERGVHHRVPPPAGENAAALQLREGGGGRRRRAGALQQRRTPRPVRPAGVAEGL